MNIHEFDLKLVKTEIKEEEESWTVCNKEKSWTTPNMADMSQMSDTSELSMSSVPPLSPDILPSDTTTDGFFGIDVYGDDTFDDLYADFGNIDLGWVSKLRFQRVRNSKQPASTSKPLKILSLKQLACRHWRLVKSWITSISVMFVIFWSQNERRICHQHRRNHFIKNIKLYFRQQTKFILHSTFWYFYLAYRQT